jgi:hypothetical protein
MLKKFKTQELIVIALIAVMVFIINLIFIGLGPQGSPQQIITLPLSLIASGILTVLVIKICPKFGVLTLFALIYGILEMPTPLGVAPGFWPKIVINVLSALVGDIFIYNLRYRNWSIFVGAWIFGILNQSLFILAMFLFGIPFSTKLTVFVIPMLILMILVSGLGMWLGLLIWKRIKNKRFIKSMCN